MKKILVLLLVCGLLLSLFGCSDSKDGGSTAPAPASGTESAAPGTEAPVPTEPSAQVPATAAPTEAPVTEAPTQAPATEAPTEAPATEAPTEVPTEAPAEAADPWSLLGEASFEQGSFTDEFGYYYTYSYDLPCLLADTPDALAINAEIDETFGGHVREALQSMEEGYAPVMLSTGFLGHVWEDVLTIEIIEHTEWDADYYGIFCYEVSTGRRLTTADVIERMGYTEEEFLASCREQFRQFYTDMYVELPEESRAEYGYYRGLDRQVTDEFVNMDLQIYPENDDIVVIAPIVSLAGADYYFHVIHLGIGGNG